MRTYRSNRDRFVTEIEIIGKDLQSEGRLIEFNGKVGAYGGPSKTTLTCVLARLAELRDRLRAEVERL